MWYCECKLTSGQVGLPAGFPEDLKMVVLARRRKWRFVQTYIKEWRREEAKYLAWRRMKIINCHNCWRWILHFWNCWRLKIWRLLLKMWRKVTVSIMVMFSNLSKKISHKCCLVRWHCKYVKMMSCRTWYVCTCGK